MTDVHLLSGDEIRSLVGEVAASLETGGFQHELVIVGGSRLAWLGLRDATMDVDSIRPVRDELRQAIAEVANAHGLAPDWLNAHAAMFAPANFDDSTCDLLLDHPRLRVLGASLRDVFVMKLYRSFPNDVVDMAVLWPFTGFTSGREAADAFVEAYPHAPDDEFLPSFVVDIAARGGFAIEEH